MEARPWRDPQPPARILAIRLQATGDVMITLPYLRALQRALPTTAIDFLTRDGDADLVRAVRVFRHVNGLGGGRDERHQLLRVSTVVPRLLTRRYDVVIDLQNNRVSRTIRRVLRPKAWSAFDRESPISAGARTRQTIEASGFRLEEVHAALPLIRPDAGLEALRRTAWQPDRPLIVLSPAGQFETRQWPIDRYARFAALWHARYHAQFVVLGLEKMRTRTDILRREMGGALIDLVGRTTAADALAIVQRATLVLTEDCGLMHMAWTSGVPTIALFGASRHDWSAPLGAHSLCLHSGDLECGACMQATCRYGDVHCLTRYSAETVVEQAERLLGRVAASATRII